MKQLNILFRLPMAIPQTVHSDQKLTASTCTFHKANQILVVDSRTNIGSWSVTDMPFPLHFQTSGSPTALDRTEGNICDRQERALLLLPLLLAVLEVAFESAVIRELLECLIVDFYRLGPFFAVDVCSGPSVPCCCRVASQMTVFGP
jgi:hypothetical protein